MYKQALSYFPILSHSCSIQQNAGRHVRAGNAGFIDGGRVGRGVSPARRDEDYKTMSTLKASSSMATLC